MSNEIPDPNQQVPGAEVPPVAPEAPAANPMQAFQQQAAQQAQQQAAQQAAEQQAAQQYAAQQQAAYQPTATPSPPDQLAGTIVLNYWLSVFFTWLPALIFYFTEKGKSPLSDQYHRDNLNFSILRTLAVLVASVLGGIPVIGWLLVMVAWIGGIVLHIMAAVKAKDGFLRGEAPAFLFNLPMIK